MNTTQVNSSTPSSTLSSPPYPSMTFTKTVTYYCEYELTFADFKMNHMKKKKNESDDDFHKRAVAVWILMNENTEGEKECDDEEREDDGCVADFDDDIEELVEECEEEEGEC